MDVVFSQTDSGKHVFSIKRDDDNLFSSSDTDFPFLGEYGSYSTREESILAFRKFAFLNPDFVKLAEIEEEQKDAIKSRVIDQFNRKVITFIRMIDQLETFDDKSKLQERVTMLKDQFDQFTKSVTDTVHEFEGDTGDSSQIEEQNVQEIGFEEVKDPFAKDLVKLKKRIRKFYRRLKSKFGHFLKAGCEDFLTKLASIDREFKNDILVEIAEDIVKAMSFDNVKIDSLEVENDESRIVISSDQGKFVVKFGPELVMTELLPLDKFSSSHPYMSHRFYNELWFPVFSSVGSYFVDDDHIIVPDQPSDLRIGHSDGKYLKNKFLGFDIRNNSQVFANVFLAGTNSPIQKTCMFTLAEKDKESALTSEMQSAITNLLSSQMVKCVNSGTKYDGIAGEIHADQVEKRAGYFEVPVTFTFDTGAEETVILPSYNLERYA